MLYHSNIIRKDRTDILVYAMNNNSLDINCDKGSYGFPAEYERFCIDLRYRNTNGLQVLSAFRGRLMIRLLSLAVLTALALVLIIAVTNLHLHISPDNKIYVHSHPIDTNSKSERHNHTQTEYVFFNIIKSLLSKVLSIFIIIAVVLHLYYRYFKPRETRPVVCDYFSSTPDRAPPAFLLS